MASVDTSISNRKEDSKLQATSNIASLRKGNTFPKVPMNFHLGLLREEGICLMEVIKTLDPCKKLSQPSQAAVRKKGREDCETR